jgi:bacillithiol system protein YtxJ
MNWNKITSETDLDAAIEASYKKPVLLFKHSTRCSISSTALTRLERNWSTDADRDLRPYYLDLIAYRPVSNAIAERTGVEHESPQAILLVDGQPVYNTSHLDIRLDGILEAARNTSNA